MIRNYVNGAPLLTLAVGVDPGDVVLEVSSTSGFPDAPFTIALERGTVNEEVVLCTDVSATTFTVLRGWDGTSALSHSVGAAVEHTTAAIDYVDANTHVNDTTGDPHSQYLLKSAFIGKGRILVGTAAGAWTALAVGSNNRVLLADSSTASGVRWGLIPTAALEDGAVTEPKLATAVQQGLIYRQSSAPGAVNGRVYYNTSEHRWYGRHSGTWRLMTFGAGRITVSTSAPSGGSNGDIHFRY